MPDQLTQYYDYLKKAGADVPPTFESFKSTLSDEPSAKQYYNYLKSNKFDAPDTFDSFANTLGLKKKEPSVPSAPVSGQPSSVPSPSPSQLPSVFKDLSKGINLRNVSDSPSPTAVIQTRIKANEMAQGGKPTMTVAEKHQKEVEAARKKVDQAIQNSDPILTRMIREGRVFDFEREISKTPTLDGFVNPAINTARKDIILNSPVKPEEIATKKQEALQNDATAREVLRRSAKNNKDVAKSAYLLDAEQRAAENPLKVNDIIQNADKIAAGELRYNIKSGILEKPENPFESIIRGFKERSQQLNDYEAFTTGSDQDVIAKLEKERASYDPDKPVPVADGGTSQFTQMLGMEGVPMVKSAAAAVLTNAIPGGQAAAPYVAAFVSSPEYYKRSYSSALRDAYFELRNKGVSEDEALAAAKKQAESEGVLGAAEGVLSSAIGARVGLKPTPIVRSSGVKGALENIVRAGGNFIKENAPEGLTDAGVAGALQIAKNIEARDNGLDRDILDGVDDNVVGELMFTFGMGTLVHGGKAVVNDKTYKTIVSALARQPKEAVDAKIGEMVVTGKATPKRAAEIGKEIDEVRAVDSKIPDEVEDVAVRTEIVDKIKQRDELKAKLAKVDEAFHPEIRQEIAKVEDEIKGLSSAQELSNLESGMAVDQAGQLTINRDGVVSNAKVETDKIKIAAPEEETGVTMNLDGTTYTGGGLVIPAASINTTQEELTPEMLADFIEQNKSKLGDGETFKVGYYKFPNSNQVSIDLNIVADPKNRETALRFGRMAGQESLFDLDTKENVKTGADGMNPRSFSDEEFTDIARSLRDGKLPSFMDVASRAKSFIIGEDETTSNVAEALKPTGIRITELPAAEFEARVKEVGGQGSEEGVFIADNGEIILNKDTASDITKIHEGAHPVMNIIYNTNRSLYDQAIAGMQKAAASNQGIQGAIEFGQQYEGEATQNDEALVETIARIGTGDIDINTIDTGFKQALIDLVNRIAKVFGFEQVLNDTDVAAFKKLAARVAEALRDGKDITDIVGEENLSNYQNNIGIPATIEANQFRVPDTKVPFVYEAKDVEQLPVKSLQDIFDQFGGKAVVINSDPTRVGELTLPSGKKIFMYGGPGYLSIKENVSGNIGFATTQISKVNSWGKYVSQLFGNSPGVTLVATQAPTSILSNSYALRYVMDAISMLPKSVLRSSDFKNEFFGKDLVLLKDAFGENGYSDFVNKYKKADLSDPKVIDGMIAEMGYKIGDDNKPASFKARGAFVSNLLGGLVAKDKVKGVEGDTGYVSKNPQKFIAKQLKDRLGINAEKVMRDIGEPSLVDVWMNEGKWGFVVSGFETDPNISTESVQTNGIKHPLFNAKLPGKNPFILDGAYEVDEMFQPIEMTGPSGAPYTKRASQMLAGSMYVKGQSLNDDGSFDFAPTESTAGRIQASKSRDLVSNAGLRKQMTEDGDNYVFFHYSDKKMKQVDPSKFGKNLATGRDERPGVGISMYYTRPDQLETNVPGDYGYSVRIPKDQVYPFNQDPLNLMPQAEKLFKKDYPGQAFDTNKQVGYVTKVAADRGYPMTVAEWTINGKKGLRAQTTEKLTVKPYRVKDPMYLNVYEFKEEFTPNALKKGQFAKSRIEKDINFKIAAFVMKEKAEGATDQEIFDGIKSVMPNMPDAEIMSAVSDPEGFIRTKFSNLSSAVQENLISRARVTKTTAGMQTDIDPAFSQLETRPEDIEAATQRPSKVEEIKKKVNEVKNKYFDAAKGLPNWIMGVKDITGGVRDLEIRKAVDLSKELKRVAASIGFTDWDAFTKAMKSLTPQAVQTSNSTGIQPWYANIAAQNKVLSMPPAVIPAEITALPEEIRPYVFAMRGMVDGLTKDLIGAGFVTPEQAQTLESNIGSYLNRAYRLFNENGYKPSDEDFKQAIKYFSDIYIKQLATQNAVVLTFEQVSKQAAEMARKTVNEILDKDLNPYFKKGEKRDVSILKERKDIPEPIRKLMGEYTDPVTVFVMTVAKQAALRSASQYLTALRNNGMGTMFFEKNDPNRPSEFSHEIAGEGSETMSTLNGLYTTPEIAEALDNVEDTLNSLTQTWMKLVGAIRWGKTVGSVVTQVKNMLSNIGFAVMNGLIFTGKNTKSLAGASQYWSGQVTGRKLDDLTQKVMALGLVNQSVGASELKRMLGSADMHDIAIELAVTGKSKGAINWIGKPFRALNKAYQLSDDFWKVYAYMNERELVSNAMFGEKYDNLTPEQQVDVDLESSERVKNTWPTYSRVWEGAKYVSERAPIFGNFISFQAESVRVLGNTFKLAMADIKSGDPAFAAIGYKRLAGMITYVGLRSALTYAAAHAAGIGAAGLMGLFDDDEEKNKEEGLRTALPAFMRTGDLLAIPQKDGQYTVFDLASIDPYGIVFKSLNALTEGREGIVGDKMEPGVAAAMAEFFSGFLEPEMTFRVMMDVANNSNPKTGGTIYREDDSRSEALLNVGKYVGDQLKPSTIGFIERLAGDNRVAEVGAVFGARPYEVDLYRSFGRVMATNGKNFEDIIREYNRVKYDKKATEAEKKEAEKKAEQDIAYYADKMSRVYRQFSSLGADPKKLNEMIANKSQVKSTGWSKGLKRSIKTGEITPDKYLK